jgi:phosphohistidine phosphatase
MADTDPGIHLYLVRHAIAADRGDEWPDDGKRPLTPKGIQRFRAVVQGLKRMGVLPDLVLTSPLVRAKQTAEILADGLTPHPPVVTAESLAPGGSQASFVEDIGKHPKAVHIACVGHEPDLGQLAARLIGARRPLAFKKGGVCCIDLEAVNGPGHLVWFAPPRLLRRVSR